MNSGEIFVLVLVLIVFGFSYMKHKMAMEERKPQNDPESRSRIDALEDRVKTLERIVTDKGYDLKREFDKL